MQQVGKKEITPHQVLQVEDFVALAQLERCWYSAQIVLLVDLFHLEYDRGMVVQILQEAKEIKLHWECYDLYPLV